MRSSASAKRSQTSVVCSVIDHLAVDIGASAAQFDGAGEPLAPGIGVAALNANLRKPLNLLVLLPVVAEHFEDVVGGAAEEGICAVVFGGV